MENGECRMQNGECRMENAEWRIVRMTRKTQWLKQLELIFFMQNSAFSILHSAFCILYS